jgi:hypothetical protein
VSRTRLPRFTAALVALLAVLVAAPAANAGPLVASAGSCSAGDPSQPFLPWLDPMDYVQQPGGTFEAAPEGWSLGTASVVDGNEPYYAAGSGSRSLSIPAGSSVTTSTMCVGLNEPTLRFFARSSGGSPLSTLRVDVQFEDALGNVQTVPIGVHVRGGWTPTLTMPILVNLLPLLPGDQTPVRFRFVPQGSASWQIDDVYVDPRRQ